MNYKIGDWIIKIIYHPDQIISLYSVYQVKNINGNYFLEINYQGDSRFTINKSDWTLVSESVLYEEMKRLKYGL